MRDGEMMNINDFDNLQIQIPHAKSNDANKWYTEFNRLLYSRTCVYTYVFLIVSSVVIFVYSIIAYIWKLDEIPIVICESILILVMTIDMIIRVYVTV